MALGMHLRMLHEQLHLVGNSLISESHKQEARIVELATLASHKF